MSSTEQAQEPTMEEILASIRRIISDEDEAESSNDDAAAEAEPDPEPEADAAEEMEVEASEPEEAEQIDFDALDIDENPEPAEAEEDILELTEVVEEEPDLDFGSEEPVDEPTEEESDIEFVDVEESEEPAIDFEAAPAMDTEPSSDDRIISDVTDAAVASAFGQLASTLLSRDGSTRTLEELVQEMLRPMLKSWLDQNLPVIVEDLVRKEIERASRRGGR